MSTTVSNPYSFNIKNNTSFTSSTITPILPDKDTILVTLRNIESRTILVPQGCKVVLLVIDSGPDDEGRGVYARVRNLDTNKYWYEGDGLPDGFSDITYVGVTPGKSYTLRLVGRGDDPRCTIYYSASINNKTPDVTDY